MAGRLASRDLRGGRWIRRLPLVSVVAFASFSIAAVQTYESAVAWNQACFTPEFGIPCVVVSPLWLPLAALWAASAVATALLMAFEFRQERCGRTLRTPDSVLIVLGVCVSVLGVAWVASAPWAGYATASPAVELGLHVAYLTAALFLFAATFVDYDPNRLPGRGWPAALAVANAGLALSLGIAWRL